MSDRVAFVTGAGKGIGAAVAGRLAAECAVLVLVDRDAEAVAEVAERLAARGVEVLPAVVDVSDAAAMDATVDDAVDRFGRLDVAVNNAGVTGPLAELVDYPDGAFWRVQQINVGGVLNGMRAQLRHMVAAGGGAIVNMTSGAGFRGVAGSSAYSASKHAVIGLTRSAAVEYAARGVRVNAVAPGLVLTRLVRGVDAERFGAAHPMGRTATVEEIAEAVVWLLSPAAAFVTGTVLPVDGGLSAAVPGMS